MSCNSPRRFCTSAGACTAASPRSSRLSSISLPSTCSASLVLVERVPDRGPDHVGVVLLGEELPVVGGLERGLGRVGGARLLGHQEALAPLAVGLEVVLVRVANRGRENAQVAPLRLQEDVGHALLGEVQVAGPVIRHFWLPENEAVNLVVNQIILDKRWSM